MDLNRLAVRARLRSPWESIDLGVVLARRQWWPLFIVWLLPATLVFGATALLLWDSPGWAIFLVWWLKPVYDRLPLLIASRALFGEKMPAGAALKQFFSVNRRDWLAWLSWRRLSPTRSFDMPVTLLEQSSGPARGARIGVLHRKHASAATWLTLTGYHLEVILGLALAALIYLLIPEQVEIDWMPFLSSGAIWLQWALNGLYLLVMAAVAPFYVVCGFSLYIGRRIELEAWDIEIQFRNLVERQRRSEKTAPLAAQLMLLCALGIFAATPALQARAETGGPPEQAREQIDEILAGENFHRMETVKGWRLKEFKREDEAFPEWLIALLEWLESLSADESPEPNGTSWGPLVAGLLEVLLWIGAIGLAIYLLWHYREQLGRALKFRKKPPREKKAAPETLFGLDVRQSSLPADVCAEVLRLWQQGEQRAGLGLLYRATLSHLIEDYLFEFGDHLTERECARLVEHRRGGNQEQPPVSSALSSFVQQLTTAWQQLAYAHRAPETARVQALCGQWQEVFAHD
ncbi:DUF4129 domain-containing protein [Microbulbifer rhizosphaerae]|uniref:Protein-glutamine gamma-glutamyltransferase-like C-terminal domain-containing protein n=1 Tax=Microbulbifer rhizosphaerae TaxID=1562603 RepID=A0A7W4WBE2_9GAMM|nr:hypothetical protein [Microbulbifer rhizosphaerae]